MASASSIQNNTDTTYFDHFTCNICLEVLHDPVQCVKNEHYFCKHCIWLHLTRTQTCPVCQDALTPETLRPISRVVANLLQQFQSPKCRYATRGCTSEVKHEALLSHHEECGFAPVQCSHEGCEATVNRQDLVSHQQTCEFRSVTCEECQETMRQREYGKHPCVFRREIDENKHGLAEIQKILREIQDKQLRQSAEIQRQPQATRSELRQPSPTRVPVGNLNEAASTSPDLFAGAACAISSPTESQATVHSQIVLAGGGSQSYEVFNWSTQKWTLHKDSLFFDHTDAFSFVYDNKMMICGGTNTNRVEFLDITNNRSVNTFPAQLPGRRCGKGVLCGDKILTFGESVSGTSLKPQFGTTVLVPYYDGRKLWSYGVARVNENSVVILGGYYEYPESINRPYSKSCKEDVLLYNPTTKVKKKLAPLPYELSDMAVVVHNDNIIILGGCKDRLQNACSDVLMYNLTNQQCSKLPSMLNKRSNCAAVIMGDTIVVMGGISENQNRYVKVKTAEYLVLGENAWRNSHQCITKEVLLQHVSGHNDILKPLVTVKSRKIEPACTVHECIPSCLALNEDTFYINGNCF